LGAVHQLQIASFASAPEKQFLKIGTVLKKSSRLSGKMTTESNKTVVTTVPD